MRFGFAVFLTFSATALSAAGPLDVIGLTALRSIDPTLDGTGIAVAQVEASGPGWEANPNAIGEMQRRFSWVSADGSSTNFPNPLGTESGHANEVANLFFGPAGVARAVLQVDNFEAGYFTSDIIPTKQPITAKVVNQSFAFFTRSVSVDQDYDDYAARYNVLFVSGAGNSGRPKSPGTAYNGICVGAYGGVSAVGPLTDGRSKPDLVAPGSYTSFAAPLVSGAASILMQAAGAALDIRLLKALLLNGAVKPVGWSNSPAAPLDRRYGTGVLNIYNSYRQWRGGPISNSENRRGWALTTASAKDYLFNIPRNASFAATLVWLRTIGQTNISNLDLFLYRDSDPALIASSESAVDNVEHIFISSLPAGTYRLRVIGDHAETYALAYEFQSHILPRLECASGTATLIGEPLQGYQIQATTNFVSWTSLLRGTASTDGVLRFPLEGQSTTAFFRALELP